MTRAVRPVDESVVQHVSLRLHVESPAVTGAAPVHLEQIAAAKRAGRAIHHAVIVARLSAWTTLVFAVGTLVTGVSSLPGIMLGMGMALVSIVEFKSGTALKCLDATAPKRLAVNQLAFGCLLFSYAGICLFTRTSSTDALLSDPQLAAMLAPVREIEQTLVAAVYITMMVVAVIGPGLAAWYYRLRAKHLERYLRETPRWIIELQQAGMTL